MTSPATITSDLRKNTMTSPSLCAAGTCHISIGSPPNQKFFRAVKKVSVGQSATSRVERLTGRGAHPVHHVLEGDHACTVAEERATPASAGAATPPRRDRGDAGLRDGPIAAGVIQIGIGVDDPAHRADLQLLDFGDHLVSGRRIAGIDDERAFVAHLHGDVRSGAANQVNPALHRNDHQLIAKLRVIGTHTRL